MSDRPAQPDPDATMPPESAPTPSATSGSMSMWSHGRDPDLPECIGGYRILGLLGAGGMGQVFLAEQETPRRTVALKVIRPGPGSESLLKRFQHEVSVLGMLKHHGIAQIYDAGVAESGGRSRPYFAMELVKGRPIGEYAADARLSVTERLELFTRVCDAVQHAHHKGVIHRDLKPGNILVEEGGQPKVLDFGVARATDHDLQAVTLQTDVGQLVGTLPYMSPEQISGDPSELDTRSDVYTLGIVLFELLAGRLPHDVRAKAVTEAIRIVSEERPPRVSAIVREASGDLDTIVSKALDRDKTRRYQSAGDLADDIRRFLRDEPIHARPPSSIYQVTKFAKRHKPLVGAGFVATLFVVAGVGGVIWQGQVAKHERDRATRALKQAEEVTAFLESMLQSADPGGTHGRNARIADILPAASLRIRTEIQDAPEVQGALWETVGSTYYGLGMYPEAEFEFRQALVAFRDAKGKGEHSREALRMRHNIAVTLRHQGRMVEAESMLREAAELRAAHLGSEDPDTLRSLDNLATVLRRQGRLSEAVTLYRRVLASQERRPHVQEQDTLDTRNNLALALRDLGQLDEALALLRRTLEQKRRVYGSIKADHPEILATRHNIGRVLADYGRLDEADAELLPTLAARERELGPDHSATLITRLAVADVLRRRGDPGSLQRASELLHAMLQDLERRGSDREPFGLSVRACLASVMCAQSNFEEAEQLARVAFDESALAIGRGLWITADYQKELGRALMGLERTDEAESTLRSSLGVLESQLGATHWKTAEARDLLARLLESSRRPVEGTAAQSPTSPTSPDR